MHLTNVPGDVVLSWMPGYPGCQTNRCAIDGYLVTVRILKHNWDEDFNIDSRVTKVYLFKNGLLPEFDMIKNCELSVRAYSSEFNHGVTMRRNRYTGKLNDHGTPLPVAVHYQCCMTLALP